MAKYYGKQQPQPKGAVLWVVVALVGAFALIVVGVTVLARPASGMRAATAAGRAVGAGPRVAVDREKLDFGKVKMNTPVTAAFKVKNVGSTPLQIVGQPQVRVVQGC
jgi:hypothetical protein